MRHLIAIALVILTTTVIHTQTVRPSFEVASVKRNVTGSLAPFGIKLVRPQPGGRVTAIDVPLETLIRFAYDVKPFQKVEGDARVLREESFDVNAKAPEGTPSTRTVLRNMMQSLLAERFHLRVRWEDRDESVLALVRARRDGTLGPELRASTIDCLQLMNVEQLNADDLRQCSIGLVNGRGHIVGQRMPAVAEFMTMLLQRTVLDRTGLEGPFDFELTTTHEDLPMFTSRAGAPPPPGPGPSIFTALQEQLGLKLESQRLPVPVLIVEHVEPLIEN